MKSQNLIPEKAIRDNGVKPPNRLQIGLLVEGVEGVYQSDIFKGISLTLTNNDVELYCFSGGSLRSSPSNQFEHQRNRAYELAQKNRLDGLIIFGSLGNFVDAQEFRSFIDRFSSLPIITVGTIFDDIPGIQFDNRHGIELLAEHLIITHNCRRFAFIQGPRNNIEAQIRWEAFSESLSRFNISIDEKLVLTGDFGRPSGYRLTAQYLCDQYKNLDAIVCANDNLALGAIEALEDADIRVPYELIVTGFDGIAEGRCSIPRLTTVVQPLFELGSKAALQLVNMIKHDQTTKHSKLPALLDIQQSCGCLFSAAGVGELATPQATEFHIDDRQYNRIIQNALSYLPCEYQGVSTEQTLTWIKRLLDGLIDELEHKKHKIFLRRLDETLRDIIRAGNDPFDWQNVLHSFRQSLIEQSTDVGVQMQSIHAHLASAQIFVGDAAQRYQAASRYRYIRESFLIREFGQSLATATAHGELIDVLTRYVPQLPIESCIIVADQSIGNPGAQKRIIYAFDREGHFASNDYDRVVPESKLLPEDVQSRLKNLTQVVEILSFRDNAIGYLVISSFHHDSSIFSVIRDQLSSALKSIDLFLTLRKQADDLTVAHSQLLKLRAQEQDYLEAVKREMNLARHIQSDFLPKDIPVFKNWDIAFHFKPALEVAGDFYDIFSLPDNKAGFVIADVCGKSIGAALFMSLIRSLLRALSEQIEGNNVLQTVSAVNDYIMRNHHHDGPYLFATLFYGVLSIDSGDLCYINAGHQPPIIVNGKTIKHHLSPTGLAVGLQHGTQFGIGSLKLHKGDLLFAFTDGVNEAQNAAGELFGKPNTFEALCEHTSSAKEAISGVNKAIENHLNGTPCNDDITMFALKKTD